MDTTPVMTTSIRNATLKRDKKGRHCLIVKASNGKSGMIHLESVITHGIQGITHMAFIQWAEDNLQKAERE